MGNDRDRNIEGRDIEVNKACVRGCNDYRYENDYRKIKIQRAQQSRKFEFRGNFWLLSIWPLTHGNSLFSRRLVSMKLSMRNGRVFKSQGNTRKKAAASYFEQQETSVLHNRAPKTLHYTKLLLNYHCRTSTRSNSKLIILSHHMSTKQGIITR